MARAVSSDPGGSLAPRSASVGRRTGLVDRGLALTTELVDWAFVSVAVGQGRVMAIRCDGTLWAWGCNSDGQLGLCDNESRDYPTRVGDDSDWTRVAAGDSYSPVVKRDGSVWARGYGGHGHLGLPDTDLLDRPTRVLTP